MARRPKRLCAHPLCGELTDGTYCDRHRPDKYAGRAESDKAYDEKRDPGIVAFYKSPEWDRVRQAVLARDKGLCQECLRKGKVQLATTVHHLEELKQAWDKRFDLNNLISLCSGCHNRAHRKARGKGKTS